MKTTNERNTCPIRTAACLIIGDEVLGGKVVDTNSPFMAKWCFGHGIRLQRVEVIADDEEEIIEAVRRMSNKYDFVVTSGGIGPTHDDITYSSIAKAFGLPLRLYEPAYERMKKIMVIPPSAGNFSWDVDSPGRAARLRMIQVPIDETRDLEMQVLFPHDDMWVPVMVVNGNVHILPGVPTLFKKLLMGLDKWVVSRLLQTDGRGTLRVLISTPLLESENALYLTELAARVEPRGVKVGSYPRHGKKRQTVTLVGDDWDFIESLVPEVEKNVQGRRVQHEGEDDSDKDA